MQTSTHIDIARLLVKNSNDYYWFFINHIMILEKCVMIATVYIHSSSVPMGKICPINFERLHLQ